MYSIDRGCNCRSELYSLLEYCLSLSSFVSKRFYARTRASICPRCHIRLLFLLILQWALLAGRNNYFEGIPVKYSLPSAGIVKLYETGPAWKLKSTD